MSGQPAQWSAEQVRRMHDYYVTHPEMDVREVAEHFGLAMQMMYRLFQEHGLQPRRGGDRWMKLTREQVESMYARYLEGDLSADKLAESCGLVSVEMYLAFQRWGLPTTRRESQRTPEPADKCPAMRLHEYCPHCPCPAPRCVEGHGPAEPDEDLPEPTHLGGKPPDGQEWRCTTCRKKGGQCACWDPAVRSGCGFDGAYAEWQEERRREMERARRVRKLYRRTAPVEAF